MLSYQQQTLWIRSDGSSGGGEDVSGEASLTTSMPASVGSIAFSSPKPKENGKSCVLALCILQDQREPVGN